jgi:Tfp pilus assembly protein PilF
MAHLYESGEFGELADRLGEVVAEHPEYADLFYNLACCESLAGRTDDAIEHLRRSIELSPKRSRALARDDSDFGAIRDEPAFKELIDR